MINSYKFLSVVDHSGCFIFARLSLGSNDREVYTTSPLYLCEGGFFQMVNLLPKIVPLRVMEDTSAPTKTLAMI